MDLDKIVLQKTVQGVNCPVCGGYLHASAPPRRSWWQRLWNPPRRHHYYECVTCRRRYDLRQEAPVA